jgi:hypothetical protein
MIDIGTLSAVFAMVGPDEADRGHGGDFFHHYFTEELIRNCPLPHGSDPLAQASEYTYEYSINRTTPETEEQGSAERQVVHHGADRQTFLVAKQIAESAIRDNPTPADVQRLSRPYTYQTMRFTRDVINASGHEMDDFVRHAPALLDTPNPDAVANVSFLLGRVEGERAQQRARRMLENSRDRFLDQLSALDVPDADEATIGGLLFSLRTLFVSLIYLGDENASDQYIGYLLDDPR